VYAYGRRPLLSCLGRLDLPHRRWEVSEWQAARGKSGKSGKVRRGFIGLLSFATGTLGRGYALTLDLKRAINCTSHTECVVHSDA